MPGSRFCSKPPLNAVVVASADGVYNTWACKIDFTLSGAVPGTCVACEAGYEKKTAGNHTCSLITCAHQARLNYWQTSCVCCPNSWKTSLWMDPKIKDCLCNPGYLDIPGGADCVLCQPGKYKGYSNGDCLTCPENSGCATCPLDAVWEVWQCVCSYGKIPSSASGGLQCESCPAGTYKFENFQSKCRRYLCPVM